MSKKKNNKLRIFFCCIFLITIVIACGAKFVYDGMNLGLDLQGGFEIVYDVTSLEGKSIDEDKMPNVVSSISKRIDVLGVSEPEITIEQGNRVRVQLAGIKNIDDARDMISTTANLSFRDSNDNLLFDADVLVEGGASVGSDKGRPVVSLKIDDKEKFKEVTTKVSQSSDKLMVIWLDYEKGDSYLAESKKAENDRKYISAATVSQPLDGDCVISGRFDQEYANNLAKLINAGSLPVKMNEVYSNVVSAEFGETAFHETMIAGGIGILAVMALMIYVYRLPGIVSSISICVYLFMVMLFYNAMGGVFTLSGIAALVLGVGMAVDSSVITFERIKESMYCGRSIKTAFKEGTSKSFSTIFDSQITTLISALILYIFGTGSVKGFATMLMVSTLISFVLIIGTTRYLLGLLVDSKRLDNKYSYFGVKESDLPDLNSKEERKYYDKFAKHDYVKTSKKVIIATVAFISIAVGFMCVNTLNGNDPINFGIDFASGTRITVTSDNKINKSDLTAIFKENGLKVSEIKFSGENNKIATVALKDTVKAKTLKELKADLKDKYKHDASDSIVTPIVGRELIKNAFKISILAWIAIMIYVSIRFKWDFAFAGIVALVHDVIFVISFFALIRLEINTEFIAVLLAIIGYSINNSIVVFDRIREDLSLNKKSKYSYEELKGIVNEALGTTFKRSVISVISTLIPVLCLLVFGSNAIFTFNLALFVGLIAGGFSSLFIAAQLWLCLRLKNKGKKVKTKKKKKLDEPDEMFVGGING